VPPLPLLETAYSSSHDNSYKRLKHPFLRINRASETLFSAVEEYKVVDKLKRKIF
jgi:hypothetical protein